MAFHVEISRGFRQRARAFNLDEAKLRRTILDPWVQGRPISLGDKDWEPRDCKLIVLEGPKLPDTDLSMGRGWSNAEKTGENVTRRLIESFVRARPRTPESPPGLEELTARELEILGLIARGLSNAEIAEQLVVSTTTVKTHVARVLSKLDLRDRVQAVVLAYEAGIVVPSHHRGE